MCDSVDAQDAYGWQNPQPYPNAANGVPTTWGSGDGDPFKFFMVGQTYGNSGTEQWLDDLEIWDGIPPDQESITANAGEDQSICEGESATLTASGSQSYVWNTGEATQTISVQPTETTTYTVTGNGF